FCDRTAVMYLGRIVEMGRTSEVVRNRRHPYTRALLSATLSTVPGRQLPYFPLTGDIPSPTSLPTGCPLVGRCPIAIAECAARPVPFERVGDDHDVACIRLDVAGTPAAPLEPVAAR